MKSMLDAAPAISQLGLAVTVVICISAQLNNALADDPKFYRLSVAQMRTVLINHQVTDDAHWADSFLPGGKLGGHQLGSPQTGSWEITRQGELCVERKVKDTETGCFEVWLKNDQVQYRQGPILLSEGVLRSNP